MSMFRRAERSKAKLRLGLSGVSGSGKTYSALMVASGIVPWEKIALIDTENGSGDLYAHLGPYSVCRVLAPFTIEKYLAAIKEAEKAGFELIIIDSLSHAWSGEGGLLDQQAVAANSAKNKGNSYTAWREITPLHNKLVETLLQSPCHIIATTRSKQAYEQVEENGRKKVVKLGLAPIQREGMEYEMTVFLDISLEHVASSSKDRTGIFDSKSVILSPDVGRQLKDWLETGSDAPAPQPVQYAAPVQPQVVVPFPTAPAAAPATPAPAPAQAPATPPATAIGFPAYEDAIVKAWTAAGWPAEPASIAHWVSTKYGRPPQQLTEAECTAIYHEFAAYAKQKGGK